MFKSFFRNSFSFGVVCSTFGWTDCLPESMTIEGLDSDNSLVAWMEMLLVIVGLLVAWELAFVSWWKLKPLVKDIYDETKEVL